MIRELKRATIFSLPVGRVEDVEDWFGNMLLRAQGIRVLPVVLTVGLICPPAGCRRESEGGHGAGSADPPHTVTDTYEHLRALYERRAYGGMRAYMPADQGEPVIDLLMAVDRLLAGNKAALAAIREVCPAFPVERYDLSPIADRLGLFSRDLRLISVRETVERATVTVQYGDRLPLDSLEFVRAADRWLYQPGPPGPRITPLLSEITDTLNRLARSVARRPMSQEEIENEYRLRVRPRLRRIRELFEATGEEAEAAVRE